MIQIVQTDAEIKSCFKIMSQLRPRLEKNVFVETIHAQQKEGYQIAYLSHNKQPVAVAGYRIYHNLFMGKHLYVDDLVTDINARSKGFGQQMINWLKQHAIHEQCDVLHLDSGTQRHSAHRFYLNHGFDITSYHFSQTINTQDV